MSKPSCLSCQRVDHQRCLDPQTVPVDDTYLSPGELMRVCCCAEAHEILDRRERQVYVAYSITHGQRPDGWWYTVEIPGRPPEEHGPFINEDNVIAAKLDRMRELEGITERRAEPGELCTCGRQAIVVYLGGAFGATGHCGIGDGGDRSGPCPFCGGPRHSELEGRCPSYRLRLDG